MSMLDNRFSALVDGEMITFKRQSALDLLEMPDHADRVRAVCKSCGVEAEDADALAHNCALLFTVLVLPECPFLTSVQVLERFTPDQIAALTRCYMQHEKEGFC